MLIPLLSLYKIERESRGWLTATALGFGEQPLAQTVAAAECAAASRAVRCCCRSNTRTPWWTPDRSDRRMGKRTGERGAPDTDPADRGETARTASGSTSRTRSTSARSTRAFPNTTSTARCANGRGAGHFPSGLRRAARPGARRFSRGVLRLRHPAPELRHRAIGQDPVADTLPSAGRRPMLTELAVRHRPHAGRSGVSTSTARLLLADEVLCIGEATTLALSPDRLTGFRFGKRRV